MTDDTPSAVLRDEIAQTRADLGDTVEALAAKTDVKARAKDTVDDLAGQAKTKARDLRDQVVGSVSTATDRAAGTATAVGDQLRSEAAAVRESLAAGDAAGVVRKPLPVAGLVLGAAVAGLIIYLVRRRGA